MSRVFVAHERTLDRNIVIKVLPAEMSASVSLERFKREIQLAARMQHPHIAPLHSAGETSGLPFFTMPFIEGESLRARLVREGELPVLEAVRIFRDVASALAYAHTHGVAHRDIKPENILLSGGSAVVTDFGVAKALEASVAESGHNLTSHGVALGTPAYMAPEQASADPATDHRADIYSLGAVAFEMLAGDPLFGRRTAGATIAAHMSEAAPVLSTRRPAVPDALSDLVAKCLQKRPADRPQSAAQIVEALDSIYSGSTAAATSARVPARRSPRTALFVAALLVVIAGIAGVVFARQRSAIPAATATTSGVRALAVLPFVNVGGNSQDEYFSEGMSDELSTALSKIPGLRVASRTSTFAAGAANHTDLQEIGRRLHVDAVLEGRLRRAGNRLRLTAQLTNVGDGLAIWSESYEREVKDVFAVQDDISHSIAEALRLAMSPAVKGAEKGHGTTDVQAYDLFLRGRYFWYHRDLPKAIDYLERATARDPGFARAYSALATSYILLPEYSDNPPPDALDRSRAAASRALKLDSAQAEAYTALGLAFVRDWDWKRAEAALQRAITLEPGHATAHQWMGELLFEIGRTPESIAEMRKAAELDPLAPIPSVALCFALYLGRQPKAALSEGLRAVELAPKLGIAHRVLSGAYLMTGDTARAIAEIRESFRLDSGLALRAGQYAYVAGVTGDLATARRLLKDLELRSRTQPVSRGALLMAYLGLGDRERALHELERAVATHDIFLAEYPIVSDPIMDPLRRDPRFDRVLKAIGVTAP